MLDSLVNYICDSTEIKITLLAALIFIVLNILIILIHFVYQSLSDSSFRTYIREIIFEIDKFADEMENSQKKQKAIQQLNEVLGWRRIIIPSSLIGWIINIQVASIRRIQALTNTPSLHEETEETKGE